MSKNPSVVLQWDKNGSTYLFSKKTKKTIARKAGTRGRPSYRDADVKNVPDDAMEVDVENVSLQARKRLGLAE